jgi:hypothetical protein
MHQGRSRSILNGRKKVRTGTLEGNLTEPTAIATSEEVRELIVMTEKGVELARGIEPPTCGLQISDSGIAQVLVDWALPPSHLTRSTVGELVLFVPL